MSSWAYYNEFDPYAAQWLRNLIDAGLIAPGVVDERSIEDVRPDELRCFTHVHLFAGIGGWAYALDLAGWPRSRPIVSCSCPCQPFSAAGQRNGFADQRHLWPAAFHLIRELGASEVVGEQVASKDGLEWLDLVQADLEGARYAFGAADLCAAGVSAPHIRQRLYWVAHADMPGENKWASGREQSVHEQGRVDRKGLEYAARFGRQEWRPQPGWRGAELRRGSDGIARPIESGIEPLAHGISARMDKLRGYGNAIVPALAAEFIRSYIEARQELRAAA